MGAKTPLLLAIFPWLGIGSCSAPAPDIHIHTTAMCGCCGQWTQQLRAAGFSVEVEQTYDISPHARELGVPEQFQTCYVANIEGTFLQGEVPPADIKRMRSEFPDAAGLAVHGMSQSKRLAGDHPGDTLLFERSGRVSVFAHHHD